MNTVAVIDYGMGNLHSVAKALEHVGNGVRIIVTSSADEIIKADRVVLPGVGAIKECMAEIQRLGLDEVIKDVTKTHPFLGVCIGMQALLNYSAENDGTPCLRIVEGTVEAFDKNLVDQVTNARLKVPHMGWNQVNQSMSHPLWQDIPQASRFYFVHSYYVQPAGPEAIAASTTYGISFVSAMAQDNIFAVQFHPEKSQQLGLTLYRNFLNWDGQT